MSKQEKQKGAREPVEIDEWKFVLGIKGNSGQIYALVRNVLYEERGCIN
jgi:hypothetical protein